MYVEGGGVRTRLRKLHADGRDFAWSAEIRHVAGSGDCHRCIRVKAWGAGKNSRPLEVDLLSKTWPSPWTACATDTAYPTPADILAIIKHGLALGWDLDARGGIFLLTENEHGSDWELPDFLVTDRLRDPEAADPTMRVIHAFEQRTGGRLEPRA
ncbi:hypothetical protein GCM10014719_55390 [Planomonospora parontospora subsp. antibiotica]|nr:hypothetical protein GCM10014719_55390 [Planomonospora parontospora subsp. antibiotica]GII20265.1 hypothetical protein Ppa05_69910 [Planomonospora parontospora subsp. antibiotica]